MRRGRTSGELAEVTTARTRVCLTARRGTASAPLANPDDRAATRGPTPRVLATPATADIAALVAMGACACVLGRPREGKLRRSRERCARAKSPLPSARRV
eukprot:23048-Pelagococcus_subviridis.AAC.1